ncbi:PP2C family protein-serine/threonine phosphatase [Streptomyces sp. NPDC054847]
MEDDAYDIDAVLQQALDRLALLADVGAALAATLDVREALRRVSRLVVHQLGDWCAIDLLDVDGTLERVAVTHRDAGPPAASPLEGALPVPADVASGPVARVLRGAGPLLLHRGDFPPAHSDPFHARPLELFRQLDTDTAIVAPLRARPDILGAITVGRTNGEWPLTEADCALVEDLARRVALAVDNARLYRETSRIAERLQRSLLPNLSGPGTPQRAARYTPSQATAEVGGDWYDSFPLPHGNIAMIIGDVAGHDLRATVTMGQLRNMLRGIALDREEPPGHILNRLDIAHHQLYPDVTATCVYGVLKGGDDGPWELHYSNAGHPPPLLVTHDGDTVFLEDGHGPLLGALPDLPRDSARCPLPAGSTLVLYTDGLIERRGEPVHRGMTRLRQQAAAVAREPLEEFCDELLTGLASQTTDDVAVLATRLPA